jgi:hypothetical protein
VGQVLHGSATTTEAIRRAIQQVKSVPAAVTAFQTDARTLMADVVVAASSLTGSLTQYRCHGGRAADGAGSGRVGCADRSWRGQAEDGREPGTEIVGCLPFGPTVMMARLPTCAFWGEASRWTAVSWPPVSSSLP